MPILTSFKKKILHILRLKKEKRYFPEINENFFSIKNIFDFFPYWQSSFFVNEQKYGGVTDYKSQRVSILNVPSLYNYVNFKGKSVLELGPLEGGNTVILSAELGAREIVAIEGRVVNYVKCCVIKNLLGLKNACFILDDVRKISKEKYGTFDIALVSGILYHLDNPIFLLERLSTVTDTLVISTHYADANSPSRKAPKKTLSTKFGTYHGRIYTEHSINDIHSGLQDESFWPFEEDLIRMCKDVGYKDIQIVMKNPVAKEQKKLIYLVAKREG
ncbi:MAG: hypothetical protein ACFFBD_22615 [Candidatus Hodarchaeota archaeon]